MTLKSLKKDITRTPNLEHMAPAVTQPRTAKITPSMPHRELLQVPWPEQRGGGRLMFMVLMLLIVVLLSPLRTIWTEKKNRN